MFVLVHSPLVGASTWEPVAEELAGRGHGVVIPRQPSLETLRAPRWQACADVIRERLEGREPKRMVLVGHSAVGQPLPIIGASGLLNVTAYLFADAGVPAAGRCRVVPDWLRQHARGLAVAGRLPTWSEWWGPDVMTLLIPNPNSRARIEAELPRLPLACLDETLEMPAGWPPREGVAYLQLSSIYSDEADAAQTRGWPVDRLYRTHLEMVTAPAIVADCIVELATRATDVAEEHRQAN